MHSSLARAFGESGLGGATLEKIFRERIQAECLGCRIGISGEDLGHLTIIQGDSLAVDPKLERLRLGYCARKGCNSRFYRLTCGSVEGIDPARVLARAAALWNVPSPGPVNPAPAATMIRIKSWLKDSRIRWALGIGALTLLGLMVFAWHHDALPGLSSEPRFEPLPAHTGEAL